MITLTIIIIYLIGLGLVFNLILDLLADFRWINLLIIILVWLGSPILTLVGIGILIEEALNRKY